MAVLYRLDDARRPVQTPPHARARGWRMKLSTAVAAFVSDTRLAKSPKTAAAYGTDLGYLVRLAAVDTVGAFGEELLTAVFTLLRSRQLSGNTLYRKSTAYREFAKWGLRKGLWLTDPMNDPKFKFALRRGVPRPFDSNEAARLMALPLTGVEQVTRALLYYTGLRVTPVVSLTIGDVSFAPLRIETPTGPLEVPGTIRSVNKGNRQQLTPMAPELAPVLAGWLMANPGKGYEPVLHYADGRPYRVGTIERFTRLWGEAAQVTDCTPHRFRHTYATEMLRKGVPLEVIQRLLGHSSISTTQIYAQVGDAALVSAVLRRSST